MASPGKFKRAVNAVGPFMGVSAVGAIGASAYAAGGMNVDEGAAAAVDLATPSIGEAAMYGLAMHSPRKTGGLASGGLVGYSTFFTGFDPEQSNSFFRRFSIGRAAGELVSLTARGLRSIGIETDTLNRAVDFNKYGFGAFIDPNDQSIDDLRQGLIDRIKSNDGLRKQLKNTSGNDFTGDADAFVKKLDEKDVRKRMAGFASGRQNSFLYKMASLFGGRGYEMGDDGVEVAMEAADGTLTGKGSMTRLGGTMGKTFKGAGAIGISLAARGLVAYEVGSMAVDAASYAIGAGYRNMVESANQLQRRLGTDNYMSGGYFNRAATSERQRVIQTMNRAKLAPRDQIFGNEAFYGHRR